MKLFLSLIAAGVLGLPAQVPTPGGGENPAPSTGPRVPFGYPRPMAAPPIGKTKKGKNNKDDETLAKFTGRLIKVEDNQFIIATDDHRNVILLVDKETKYFDGENAVALKDLEFGTMLDVEASETDEEEFQAINVRVHPAPGTVVKNAPDAGDSDDADADARPKLKYGKPEPSKSAEVAEATPAPETLQPAAPTAPDPHQAFLDAAREQANEFTGTLPNFMCVEVVTRYLSDNHAGTLWKPQDVVTLDVVWQDGKEEYKNINIGGKKVDKPEKMGDRAWSTGEFGTILEDIFSPSTAATMQFARVARLHQFDALMYDFDVDREHSHWMVQEGGQSITPARTGTIWLDKNTKRVLRIEFEAVDIPKTFPADTAEMAVDYDYVLLGSKKFLVPVHAESLDCHRGMNYCSKNAIDFRNYHRFGSESEIQFSEDKPAPALRPDQQKKK